MNNFLIGMHGGFDYKKFERDFRTGFFGIEACMFKDEKDINELIKQAENNSFKFGVHFPLRKDIFKYCRDPLFLSLDKHLSENSFEAFEEELSYCKQIGAQYILVHFPKPVLIDRNLDWSSWRFANDMEWMYEDLYPYDEFKQNLEEMFNRLSVLSDKHEIQIVLEHDAINKYLYKTDLLDNLLRKYSNIKICLDTGRLHLIHLVNKDFDDKAFVQRMAPFTYIVHLWNTNPRDNMTGGHYPVLPELKLSEGWGDIESYLKILTFINKDVKILFEHRSDLISDEQLEACYKWIGKFFGGINENI